MKKKNNVIAKQIRRKRAYKHPGEWFAELHRIDAGPFMLDGRNQPILHTKSEKKRFSKLADQLSATSDPSERKRIKEDLTRIAFGEVNQPKSFSKISSS